MIFHRTNKEEALFFYFRLLDVIAAIYYCIVVKAFYNKISTISQCTDNISETFAGNLKDFLNIRCIYLFNDISNRFIDLHKVFIIENY